MERLSSNEIKDTIFNIMVYFDKVCRKHNLKYFLAAGTCLGAVRHKDFIPWDDDADVFMDRESYNKFRQVMKEENSQYKLFCYQDCDGYFYPYYKLVDTQTIVKEKFLKKIPGLGVFLDIFPLDGMPNDPKLAKKLIKKSESMHYRLIINNLKCGFGSTKLAKKIDELSLKYPVESCKLMGCTMWIGREKCFDSNYIKESVELTFRGHKFFAFKKYDEYLTTNYGDYMTPPPENKRKAHGLIAFRKEN